MNKISTSVCLNQYVSTFKAYQFHSYFHSMQDFHTSFNWRLSNSKSFHVSKTLLSILVDFNSAMVWMALILPLISNFSSCNATMTPNKCLHDPGSNRSLCVALCLKFQFDPCCNLTLGKSDKHKTLSWFVNTKVHLLLHLLVVVEKKETEYELSWSLKQDRNKMSWGVTEQTQTLIFSFSFSIVILACAYSLVPSLPFCRAHSKCVL